MQAEARLSRTRGAKHERCGAARDTAADHLAKLVDADGTALVGPLVVARWTGEQRLDLGIDDDALICDPERMPTAQCVGAAELAHLDFTLGLGAEQHIVQFDEPVDHRVLGVIGVATAICQQQRRAPFNGYVGLKLVDELLEVALRLARLLGGDQTVEDDQRRMMRPNFVPQIN